MTRNLRGPVRMLRAHFKRLTLAATIAVPALASAAAAQYPTTPDSARLVVDDLRNFVGAMQALASTRDTLATLEREYLSRATPGLRAFAERYNVTPQTLAAAIRKRPRHYASLGAMLPAIERLEPRIHAAFSELERIYPDALFPPVYFLVGDFSAGGLTRPQGLLISVEVFRAGSKLDRAEFPDSTHERPLIDSVTHLVAHELAHFQQAVAQGVDAYRSIFGERQTLLRIAIREGSADFIAELISGEHSNPRAEDYGMRHERELWAEFRGGMHQRELGDWMFYRPEKHPWPANLGYFMGYRIAKSYYEKHADKSAALRAIMGVTDYEQFLRDSGYGERFK